eukprot:1087753-Pelagomonas_calceolata.AAC.1
MVLDVLRNYKCLGLMVLLEGAASPPQTGQQRPQLQQGQQQGQDEQPQEQQQHGLSRAAPAAFHAFNSAALAAVSRSPP